MVYEAWYPHIFQVGVSNPASEFAFNVSVDDVQPQLRQIIRRILAQHPKRQRVDFTDQHYEMVALYFSRINWNNSYVFCVRSLRFQR